MHMGVYPLIEIYLFVNPLGKNCAEAEKLLIDFTSTRSEKIDLTIIPLINQRMITATFEQQTIDLETRNHYFRLAYTIALDFKAAQIQGKKGARQFLLALQHQLLNEGIPYSESLIKQLFLQTGGDYAMFKEDRHSALIKDLFLKDQCTARDFQVYKQTSAVIYNCYREEDGLLLEGLDLIQEVIHLQRCAPRTPSLLQPLKMNKAYN